MDIAYENAVLKLFGGSNTKLKTCQVRHRFQSHGTSGSTAECGPVRRAAEWPGLLGWVPGPQRPQSGMGLQAFQPWSAWCLLPGRHVWPPAGHQGPWSQALLSMRGHHPCVVWRLWRTWTQGSLFQVRWQWHPMPLLHHIQQVVASSAKGGWTQRCGDLRVHAHRWALRLLPPGVEGRPHHGSSKWSPISLGWEDCGALPEASRGNGILQLMNGYWTPGSRTPRCLATWSGPTLWHLQGGSTDYCILGGQKHGSTRLPRRLWGQKQARTRESFVLIVWTVCDFMIFQLLRAHRLKSPS